MTTAKGPCLLELMVFTFAYRGQRLTHRECGAERDQLQLGGKSEKRTKGDETPPGAPFLALGPESLRET